MSYFVTAKIQVRENASLDDASRMLKNLSRETLKEPGCSQFSIHQSKEDPRTFILWEHFNSEQELEKHFEYDHTKEAFESGLTEIIEVSKTNLISES